MFHYVRSRQTLREHALKLSIGYFWLNSARIYCIELNENKSINLEWTLELMRIDSGRVYYYLPSFD